MFDDVSDSAEAAIHSFDEFVGGRLVWLLRLTGALTGDPHLAEDLVQEVLLRVHRDWARIGALDVPEAYVRRMLINEFLSWRRRWGRVLPRPDVEPARTEPDHAVVIADRDALRQRLSRLPRGQRVVLTLRYFEGLSDTEIAAEMGCSPGTVRGYASRALSALRIDGSDAPDPPREPADGRPSLNGPNRTSAASRGGTR